MSLTITSLPQVARAMVLVALVLQASACSTRPPTDRPRDGASPIMGGTPVRLGNALPPTLAPAALLVPTATPAASPTAEAPASPPAVAASPVASPGLSPIISGLQPAPGATLPAGDVVIGARVSGSSDLVDITAFVDGEPIEIDLAGQDARMKVVSLIRRFATGPHEVRIQARDDRGQVGGYRWQFTIGAGRAAVPALPTAAAPVPTLVLPPLPTRLPIPTRRPTVAPTPAPTRVPLR